MSFASQTCWHFDEIFVDVRVDGFPNRKSADDFGGTSIQRLLLDGQGFAFTLDDGRRMPVADHQITASIDLISADNPDLIVIRREDLTPLPLDAGALRRRLGRDVSFQSLSFGADP